jgi:hypothetical protein
MMIYGIPNTSECPQPGTAAYDISTTEDVWKYERVYHFFFHTGKYLITTVLFVGFYCPLLPRKYFLSPSVHIRL